MSITRWVSRWVLAVDRSDRLVGTAVEGKGDSSVGGGQHGLVIDVVAGQLSAVGPVDAPVNNLHDVQGVALRCRGVVVVDQLGVPGVSDPPFPSQRGADGDRVNRRPVHRDQLGGQEDRRGRYQQVRSEPYMT